MRELLLGFSRNAVYQKEIRALARRHRHLFGPLFVASIEVLLTVGMVLSSAAGARITLEEASSAYFWVSLVLAEGLVLLATPALASLTISREHNQLTLEQVLVTPMPTPEILWGKLSAVAVEVGLGAVPALAIAYVGALLSGETDYMVEALTEGAVICTLAAVAVGPGLLFSIAFRKPATALGSTYAVVLGAFCAGWAALGAMAKEGSSLQHAHGADIAVVQAVVRGSICLLIGLACLPACFRRLSALRAAR